ncbi:hypothetical protein V8F20_006169 [Naviculisporaceae sp. PSN 640]
MRAQILTPVTTTLSLLLLSLPVLSAPPPEFTPNPRVGPSNNSPRFKDSPHFRIYNAPSDSTALTTLNTLESAYQCFVTDLSWRSPGLSFRGPTPEEDPRYTGPYYKLNIYTVSSLPGAAANTPVDLNLGYAYLNVLPQYLTESSITVHEFGHALTYTARYWIDQGRTGAWWETIANFVADTWLTHSACSSAKAKYSQPNNGNTLIDLPKVIGDSHQVIVDGSKDTGNYYQAWPFLTYMFNNPDNFTGLGRDIFPNVWMKYNKNSNETPLHVLDRLVQSSGSGKKIQEVVGRYWARMAFVDIGHPKAQAQFNSQRNRLNYANLDSQGNGRYRVKSARQPRYMGANIIPLKGTGTVTVNITVNSNMPYVATLAVRGSGGIVRYTVLSGGSGQVVVASGEEAALVVANTPGTLYLYDPFSLTSEVSRGLDYQVQITGASV